MLQINDLTYRIAGRLLLDRATLTLPTGHHAGLVGRNGTGKSTLLKLITGELHADGGDISLPNGARIGMLAQEAPDGPESLLDTVLSADRERTALLEEAETATDPHRIAEIHTRLADIGAHAAPARAATILSGLGFDAEAQARPCSDFSGGWRMRVALAAVLFSEPDLLLLDEPTNHLDLEATLWLESFLKSYPRTLLLVSHDRDLLNKAVDKIIHLEGNKLTLYGGGYDVFERTRSERLANQAAAAAKQLAARRHMQAFVDRFRYKASKARQAQSRIKALARMEPIASIIEERTVSFDFPSPDPLAPPLITLDDVDVGYAPDRPVLRKLDLRLDMDDRIALLGANGNGKSTLVKLLAGRLKPLDGELRKSAKLRIGYFAQHQAEELDLTATPLMLMERLAPMATEQKRRAHLGRFGFGQEKALTTVGALSGGEKARLLFALMSREAPHILLLDEPTNHLDVDSRQALVQAINGFEGAVVLISHDPHLIELTADRLWLVADGGCRPYDGDLDDYRRLLLNQRRNRNAEAREAKQSASDGADTRTATARKEQRKAAAEARAAVQHLRRAAEEAEKRLEKLQARKAALEARLADPVIYEGPTAQLMELQVKFGEIKKEIARTEERWLEAQAALE
ncbi:ABC-F family ATP-binding cassette domain-containing protein [Rhodospirillaceae bacterium SYSU D60014]|uniref:ABC-F family ATP-binding cassette domain-containing protein n=1 Tax=Virgifigura deserti TaxID=2268457 RepID=UPI000E6674EC